MAFFNEFPFTRTYDSDLGWLIEQVKKLINQMIAMMEWKTMTDDEIKEINARIAELQKILEDIEAGNLPDLYLKALENWLNEHFVDYVGNIVKMVMFGLTTDGYFVAAIPYTWQFITFDTIMDIKSKFYGHLVLQW